jgi:hypothetical protein
MWIVQHSRASMSAPRLKVDRVAKHPDRIEKGKLKQAKAMEHWEGGSLRRPAGLEHGFECLPSIPTPPSLPFPPINWFGATALFDFR